MLGWQIWVFRHFKTDREELIVQWKTGINGLDWVDQLVKDGNAKDLGGNGYPNLYEISASVLIPILTKGLHSNDSPLVFGDDYLLPTGFSREPVWRLAPKDLNDEEILSIEVWDES